MSHIARLLHSPASGNDLLVSSWARVESREVYRENTLAPRNQG